MALAAYGGVIVFGDSGLQCSMSIDPTGKRLKTMALVSFIFTFVPMAFMMFQLCCAARWIGKIGESGEEHAKVEA